MPELSTERLSLRALRREDLPALARLNADREVMEFFVAPMARHESNSLAARIHAHFAQHGFGLWALELPREGRFIGFAGLSQLSFEAAFTPCVEISWRLCRDVWGHGYATEAARAALGFGFEALGLAQIVSFTVPANLRSRRVMEKLGMKRDEREDFEHPRVPEGHPLRTHMLYRLPRERWVHARGGSAQ